MQELQGVSSMRELSHSFAAATASPEGAVAGKMREFEIEMERLASKIEHLKAQNEVLGIALGESKNQCESLTVLIGERAQTLKSIINSLFSLSITHFTLYRKVRVEPDRATVGGALRRPYH